MKKNTNETRNVPRYTYLIQNSNPPSSIDQINSWRKTSGFFTSMLYRHRFVFVSFFLLQFLILFIFPLTVRSHLVSMREHFSSEWIWNHSLKCPFIHFEVIEIHICVKAISYKITFTPLPCKLYNSPFGLYRSETLASWSFIRSFWKIWNFTRSSKINERNNEMNMSAALL